MENQLIVDQSALIRLLDIGGLPFLEKMSGAYKLNVDLQLENAERGLSEGNVDALPLAAHSIRSSAGNLGAKRLHEIATQTEETARSLSAPEQFDLLEKMQNCHKEVLTALDQFITSMKKTKPSIAVVEDNPDNRFLLEALLEDLYQLTSYENGPEALEGMKSSPPDLVLMDISLPEMDGREVLRRMKADSQLDKIPVIALTAHAMQGDRAMLLSAGFDEYVMKPIVDETILFNAISKLLTSQ